MREKRHKKINAVGYSECPCHSGSHGMTFSELAHKMAVQLRYTATPLADGVAGCHCWLVQQCEVDTRPTYQSWLRVLSTPRATYRSEWVKRTRPLRRQLPHALAASG